MTGFTHTDAGSADIIEGLVKRIDLADDCIISQELVLIRWLLDRKPQDEMRYETPLEKAWFALSNGLITRYEVDENGVHMYAKHLVYKTDRWGFNYQVNVEIEIKSIPFRFARYSDRTKQIKRWIAAYLYQYADSSIIKGRIIQMYFPKEEKSIA